MLQRVVVFLLFVLALAGIGRIWYSSKAGFGINRITPSFILQTVTFDMQGAHEIELQYRASETSASVMELLNQPYRYLARGRQCYAFVSADGKYVLKLPRFDHFHLPLKWRALRSFFFPKAKLALEENRKSREVFLLESFRIASNEFSQHSALIYSHLQPTKGLLNEFTLVDALGRSYKPDLNRLIFLVQEKKPLAMPLLLQAAREGDRRRVEELLGAFFHVIEERSKLGIFNKDPSFVKNFGWDGERCVQIDLGSFYHKTNLDEQKVYKTALIESTYPVRVWLQTALPEFTDYFDRLIGTSLCEHSPTSSF